MVCEPIADYCRATARIMTQRDLFPSPKVSVAKSDIRVVELFAIGSDETENLGWESTVRGNASAESLVMRYNTLLNDLIGVEIGTDDGDETKSFVGGLDAYAAPE